MNDLKGTDLASSMSLPSKFKYQVVIEYIEKTIAQGGLLEDEKLPSIRSLSTSMGISKNSVIKAYEILEGQDTIYSVPRSGYRVKKQQVIESKVLAPTNIDLLSVSKEVLSDSKVRHKMPAGSAHPSSDLPAIRHLYAEIGRHSRRQTHSPSHYQLPPGNERLLKQLVKVAHDGGLTPKPSDIVVTNGAQQAISLAFRAVTQPGDIVAVETPCYFGLLLMLESLGLKVIEIPCDVSTGMSIDALAKALDAWPVKAVLVTPNFSNPTGSLMPLTNRKRLLDVCGAIPIIEDDVFGGLHFTSPLPSLMSLDRTERVIYVSSLSKTLDSRLRIGWVISAHYQETISKRLISENMGGHNLIQSAVADFLVGGRYKQHLAQARKLYQRNMQLFYKRLRAQLDSQLVLKDRYFLSKPSGSFICWLVLPHSICAYRVYQEALKHEISILPGRLFATTRQFEHCIRFSLANFHDTMHWHQAIEKLTEIIVKQLK